MKKQHFSWTYKGQELKAYLRENYSNIFKTERKICNVYKTIKTFCQKHENYQNKIELLIDKWFAEEYEKYILLGRVKWTYKGQELKDYLRENYSDVFKTEQEIDKAYQTIRRFCQREENYQSKIEFLIDKWFTEEYEKYMSLERVEWTYRAQELIIYLRKNYSNVFKTEREIYNVYQTIKTFCQKHENYQSKIEFLIDKWFTEEYEKYVSLERVEWTYKGQKLMDYLRESYSDIFKTEQEINKAYVVITSFCQREENYQNKIEFLIDKWFAEEYEKYISLETIEWTYKGQKLIDYLRKNYSNVFKTEREICNVYQTIKIFCQKHENYQSKIELLIDKWFSEEYGKYVSSEKVEWTYKGQNLKDYLRKNYSDVFKTEKEINRAYEIIRLFCQREENYQNKIEFLIEEWFEYHLNYYLHNKNKRDQNNQLIEERKKLKENNENEEYLIEYCKNKDIDIDKTEELEKLSFSKYTSIILLETYFNEGVTIDKIEQLKHKFNSSKLEDVLFLYTIGYDNKIYDILYNEELYKQIIKIFESMEKNYGLIDMNKLMNEIENGLLNRFIIKKDNYKFLSNTFLKYIQSIIKNSYL